MSVCDSGIARGRLVTRSACSSEALSPLGPSRRSAIRAVMFAAGLSPSRACWRQSTCPTPLFRACTNVVAGLAIFAILCWGWAASVATAQGPMFEPLQGSRPTPSKAKPSTVTEPVAPRAPAEEALEETSPAADGPAPFIPQTACEGRSIRRVLVEGARRVATDDIFATVKLRRGEACRDLEVTRDVRSLWNLGFFEDITVEVIDVGKDAIDLKLRVRERPAIGRVVYHGNKELDDDELDEKVTLKRGEILSLPEVQKHVQIIRDLYAEKGYFLSRVRYELKPIGKAGSEVEIHFHIEEGEEVRVRHIRFVGNRKVDSQALRKIMQTSETRIWSFISSGNKFNQDKFNEDVTRLQAVYYDKGYLAMRVGTVQVELTPDRQHIDITVPIDEGPRFRIRGLKVREQDPEGRDIEPLGGRKKVREQIKAKSGDWFNRSKIAESLQSITRKYKDKGYAKAEVVPQTDLDMKRRTVDVVVAIRRGPLVRIERINVRGNTKTRDQVIRRELKIFEGDLYSQTLIERSRARVEALGYFERVEVSEESGSRDDLLVLNFEVAEKSTGTFQVGAGFSSIESILLTAQVQQQNLFGRGQSLSLQLQLSGIRRLFQIRFVEPYLFGTQWSLAVDAFRTTQQYVDFLRQSTGGGLTFGHPIFDDRLRLYLRYNAQVRRILANTGGFLSGGRGQGFNIFRRLPLANLYQTGFTSSLELTLTYDARDNRIFPTNGVYLSAGTEVADKFLGSQNDFVRNTGIIRLYKKLLGGLVLKFNNEWGLITSRNPEGVPLDLRYYLGGIFTMRGYPLNSVGPRAGLTRTLDPNAPVLPQGFPIGGNLQGFYNLELEFPIVQQVGIRGVLFTDGGNTWNLEQALCSTPKISVDNPAADPCQVDIWRIRTSAGFGIRWVSPLGPLRFEWGFPFARQEYERPMRFEFTIGNFF